MKNQLLLGLFILLLCGFFFSSFRHSLDQDKAAIEKIQSQFHQGMEDLEALAANYAETALAFSTGKTKLKDLQKIHLDTRYQFKKIEYLLEYFDHTGVKKLINGAPLPTVEPSVPEVVPIAPVGLQVLDELVFSDAPQEDAAEIVRLSKKLQYDLEKFLAIQKKVHLTHRHIFEAARLELIRVFTLGLTGFDTPGSVNALPEASVALQSIQAAMEAYLPLLEEKRHWVALELQRSLQLAIQQLDDAEDFDHFDRLDYLKEYINPLYGTFLEAQQILQIEMPHEVNPRPQAINYASKNIFDPEFLNKSYYANIDLERPVIQKRAALGRLLFFDPVLSSNNKRSCNSCHQPDKAFAENVAKSQSLTGEGVVQRNAPSLINAVFSKGYFYDLREPNLERQIMHVVMDDLEFDTDFPSILKKMEKSSAYQALFAEAYADQPNYQLSKWSISDALACYVASLTSFDSPFDQYVRGERKTLNEEAKQGFNLFMGKAACGTCHFAPVFNGTVPPLYDESETEILGVPASADPTHPELDHDPGRYASGKPRDQAPFYQASFKTVSVRNVSNTAPYMHNGVYQTLEQVMDFYNKGGGTGLGFEVPHQTLPDTPLELSDEEQSALIAFMEALTDDFGQEAMPEALPEFDGEPGWNARKVGGEY